MAQRCSLPSSPTPPLCYLHLAYFPATLAVSLSLELCDSFPLAPHHGLALHTVWSVLNRTLLPGLLVSPSWQAKNHSCACEACLGLACLFAVTVTVTASLVPWNHLSPTQKPKHLRLNCTKLNFRFFGTNLYLPLGSFQPTLTLSWALLVLLQPTKSCQLYPQHTPQIRLPRLGFTPSSLCQSRSDHVPPPFSPPVAHLYPQGEIPAPKLEALPSRPPQIVCPTSALWLWGSSLSPPGVLSPGCVSLTSSLCESAELPSVFPQLTYKKQHPSPAPLTPYLNRP